MSAQYAQYAKNGNDVTYKLSVSMGHNAVNRIRESNGHVTLKGQARAALADKFEAKFFVTIVQRVDLRKN